MISRSALLTLTAAIAATIGGLALIAPEFLIETVKAAPGAPSASVMARTVGVLLVAFAVLNFSVRKAPDSPTVRGILLANLVNQLLLLPIDPIAYAEGTFTGLGSFVPNTVLHLALAAAFAYHYRASLLSSRAQAN